jgi:predicted MFS family arabinose efflux permease
MTHQQSGQTIPLGLLAAAGFLSSAGARVMDPLLNAIATDFRTTVPNVAIVITAFTLPYGINQLVLGPIGDRFGKLRVILCALLAYTVTTLSCAFSSDLTILSICRVFAGASSAGLIPVSLAYIGDAVAYEDRQVTLSRYLMGGVLAMILAGPLGGVFGDTLGWRGVFVVLAALSAVVALLLWRRLHALPDRRNPAASFTLAPYLTLARSRLSRQVLLASMLDGMLMPGFFPFIAPFLHEGYGLSYAGVGLVLSCFGLGALIYIRTAKRFVPMLGEHGMVTLGGVMMSAALLFGVWFDDWRVFVPVEIILGLGFFTLHGVLQTRATEMLPEARTTSVSSFAAMLFLGQSIGAAGTAALIAAAGYRVALVVDAVLLLGMALWLRGLLWRLSAR